MVEDEWINKYITDVSQCVNKWGNPWINGKEMSGWPMTQ